MGVEFSSEAIRLGNDSTVLLMSDNRHVAISMNQ